MEAIADYTDLRPVGSIDQVTRYLARPPGRVGGDAPVELQVLGLDDERLAQVAQELQLFAGIGSPFLVKILDAAHDDGRFLYAVEHLSGGTLAKPAGELSAAGILKVVTDAALGAHALHEGGIAHGAISPARIALHEDGAKLAELELAHITNPGMTVGRGTPVASVECIDPAVIRGEPAGRASDIWSLGVTLHRTITARSPYGDHLPEGNLLGAVRRILSTRPEPTGDMEPEVAALVRACLAPDPDDRPPTALAVAGWLEELL